MCSVLVILPVASEASVLADFLVVRFYRPIRFCRLVTYFHALFVHRSYLERGTTTLNIQLTESMEQSHSLKAYSSSVSIQMHSILCNRKVHHCFYERPPPVAILSQTNPFHVPLSILLEDRL